MFEERVQRWDRMFVLASRMLAGLVALTGAFVVLGWATDVSMLTHGFGGATSMKANMAIAFVLAGAALLISLARPEPGRGLRWAIVAMAGVILAIGLWTLVEYAIPRAPSIDQLLFHDVAELDSDIPGRMALMSAVNLVLVGMALLMLDARRASILFEVCANVAFLIGLFVCIAYAYGVQPLFGVAGYTYMAPHTALTFVALSLAILFARPHGRLRSLMSSDSVGGSLARRLLPAAIVVPFVIGMVRLTGQEAGYYGTEFGLAAYVLSQIIVFSAMIVWFAFSARRSQIETRRLDRELSQSEALFGLLFESAPDPVLAVDREGRIVRINAQGERAFGYERQQILGQPVEVLIPERYGEGHVRQRDGYIAGPHARPMGVGKELYARRHDGSEFPVEISLNPLKTELGLIVFATINDITARKKVEQDLRDGAAELARSNADLEQFAYVASHDLQEPLRAMAGCVQLLKQRYGEKLDERADELVNHAVEGAVRMQTLLNDLLSFSRVGTRGKAFEPIDCNLVLRQAKTNLEVAIRESDATIIDGQLPTIRADGTQMLQVFQNLIGNAVKFRGDRAPEIRIAAAREQDQWHFTVQDNGIGMEKQYFERIFGVFQRLHTRREYPGTGIGLAICKKIVERHGGTIWVDSEPGRGTTFHFTIPEAR